MIRVAHLLPNMGIGGRERIVADLCRTAPAHGIEPVVIAYDPIDGLGPSASRRPGEGRGLGRIPPTLPRAGCGPGLRRGDEILLDASPLSLDRRRPDFATALADLLSRQRIDILHAHGHIAAALAHPAMARIPTIATLHIALGRGWRWLPAIARGLRAADAVTAVSDDLATRFRRVAGQPIAIIPTAVDLARFTPPWPHAPAHIFTIGIAARLHPVKRHCDAIAALCLLAHRGLRCRLLIAGDGPEAAAIRRAAPGLDIALLGNVADMSAFLSGLDAFVLPSDHEGTPAALLEAMACGLPCIATAVGGVPTLVGDAALLVPRRRPHAIADAIARLIADAHLRHRLGCAAAERASRFSLDRQARAYAVFYRDVYAGGQVNRSTISASGAIASSSNERWQPFGSRSKQSSADGLSAASSISSAA